MGNYNYYTNDTYSYLDNYTYGTKWCCIHKYIYETKILFSIQIEILLFIYIMYYIYIIYIYYIYILCYVNTIYITLYILYIYQEAFPYWGIGGNPPTSQKFADSPRTWNNFFLHQKLVLSLLNKKFSCNKPIKTSLLILVIGPALFLF